tara:strand:+ start:97 stop:312 length:216 start_codon:yes stop_codon:yes gene_type:complete
MDKKMIWNHFKKFYMVIPLNTLMRPVKTRIRAIKLRMLRRKRLARFKMLKKQQAELDRILGQDKEDWDWID